MKNNRTKFESWAQSEGYLLEVIADNANSYEFPSTRHAWYGYDACAAANQTKIEALEAELHKALKTLEIKAKSLTWWQDQFSSMNGVETKAVADYIKAIEVDSMLLDDLQKLCDLESGEKENVRETLRTTIDEALGKTPC